MKKIFTLTIFSLVALLSFADDNRNHGGLSVTNLSNQDIRVEVDGRLVTDYNNAVFIPGLPAGVHSVKIYGNNGRRNGNRVFKNNGYRQFIYNGAITVRPRVEIQITVNQYGLASVKEVPMFNGRGRNNGRWDNNRRDRDDDWYDRNDPYDRNDRYDGYNTVMNERAFSIQLDALQRERFEATRFDIARQLISRNFFTTAQVKQIAQTFSFENNRLELAKSAYGKTVDKQYYALLYDVLSSANSRRELAQYMNNYR